MLVCAVGVLLNSWLACNTLLRGAWQGGRNDFLGFYEGAKLVGTPGLYDRRSVGEVQRRAVGDTFEIEYGRLPYYAWMLKPLGLLPYRTAYLVWEIMLAAAFVGFLVLWPSANPRMKWYVGCWSLPAFVSLFNGQDDLLLLWWVALAAWLLRTGRPVSAGLLLTLCASKYHLFILVPLVILAQRRWRMAAGGAAGGAILLLISFMVAGKDWVWRYWAVLTHPEMSTSLAHMPNLHSLFGVGRLGLVAQLILTIALAAGVFLAARRTRSFEQPVAVALATGLLIGVHGYINDCPLLMPAIMVFAGMPHVRVLAQTLATMIPWYMLQLQWPWPAITQLLILMFASACILLMLRSAEPPPPGHALHNPEP